MRAYYAIYIYYYTYDVTWYAWYGWVWTALEAQLGVMCASGPALKEFFKRYFGIKTGLTRASLYGNPVTSKSDGTRRAYGKMSPGQSFATSIHAGCDASRCNSEPLPLDGIKSSRSFYIIVE